MNRLALVIAFWVVAGLFRGIAVRAQDVGAADQQRETPTVGAPETFVNDNFEARELLDKMAEYARRGKWIDAARTADTIAAGFSDTVVPDGPNRYVSITRRLNETLSHWPADGLAAYRTLFDSTAREKMEEAVRRREVDALLGWLDRYFCTSFGVRMAEAAAELAIESGDFETARRVCLRVIDQHPESRTAEPEMAARLALTAALSGRDEEVDRWLARHEEVAERATVRWMGMDLPLAELVQSLASDVRSEPASQNSFRWPMFGGGGDRNGSGSFALDHMALLWRFDRFATPTPEGESPNAEPIATGATPDESSQPITSPIMADGLIFMQDADGIRALHAHTGRPAWQYRDNDGPHGVSRATDAGWHSPTYAQRRLFLCVGDEGTMYYGFESTNAPSAVVCLDARTGRELWRADPLHEEASYLKSSYGTSPAVVDGSVYVVARRQRTFGFEDCYLLRLRASDGALLFQTHVGSASTGGFGYRRPTLSVPAVADGTVYVMTNLGSIAAVSARTGRVEWLRLYDRVPETEWRTRLTGHAGDAVAWHLNAPIRFGDRLICRPMDASAVLVLDRTTGKMVSTIDVEGVGGADILLGVRDGKLYGAGVEAFCVEIESGRTVWKTPLPTGAISFGRGILSGDQALVPTDRSLCGFNMETGVASELPWNGPKASGNLLATPEQLIVSGIGHISAFGRKADVWGRLRSAMVQRPDDPLPALDLAEIAYRTGERDDAIALLDQAIARAGGFAGIADADVGDRVFQDCLWFARDWPIQGDAESRAVERLYTDAGQSAPDRAGHVRYRMTFAAYLERAGDVRRAVALYQQILNDRSLRDTPTDQLDADQTAGAAAARRIEQAIAENGQNVYAEYDAEAVAWLSAARGSADIDLVDRIIETRPAATAAADAFLLKADLLRKRGQPATAAKSLLAALERYTGRLDGADVMRRIADCYVEAANPREAWLWLDKAAQEYPLAQVAEGGRTVPIRAYRDRLADAGRAAQVRRPRITPPLRMSFERSFGANVNLLEPTLEPSPDSNWRFAYLYSDGDLLAIDASTGAAAWENPAKFDEQPELLIATNDRVLLATRYRVTALDPKTGTVVWSGGRKPDRADNPNTDPESLVTFYGHAYDGGRLLSVMDDGRAACVDAVAGTAIWEQPLRYRPASPLVMRDEWVVYQAAGRDAKLLCVLDAKTGELARTIEVDEDGQLLETHLQGDGRLVLVFSRAVYAFDIAAGDRLWRRSERDNISASTIVFDLSAVYFVRGGSHLAKVSTESGATLWQCDPFVTVSSHGAEAMLNGGRLILASDRGVAAVSTGTGRLQWEASLLPGVNLRYRCMTESFLVVVDSPMADRQGGYTAYFIDDEGRIADADGILDMGTFDDVRRVAVRDGAVILQRPQTIHGWTLADPKSHP